MIDNINKIKNDNHKYIFLEELIGNSLDIEDEIERKTGLCFPDGKVLKIYNIKIILEKMLEFRKNLREEEILIICKDENLTYEIIRLLHESFSFISILEKIRLENIKCEDLICENILKDMGLSIFRQKDLSKSIKKYGIIINMEKDIYIDKNNIKKEAIILDYSNGHIFRHTKNNVLIEDITINSRYKENSLISGELISSLHEKLNESSRESFHRIYSRGKLKTLEELINRANSLKGSI